MRLETKIQEIAEDYAAFTHQDEGWEEYLSIAEYGQLRKMALDELSMPNAHARVNPARTKQEIPVTKEIHKEFPVEFTPVKSVKTEAENRPNTIAEIKAAHATPKKEKTKAELAVELFNAMGSGD